jgi:hypothetical protein
MVLARGLIGALGSAAEEAAAATAAALELATLFFRARLVPGTAPLALSRRLRGREEGVVVWCSFCW